MCKIVSKTHRLVGTKLKRIKIVITRHQRHGVQYCQLPVNLNALFLKSKLQKQIFSRYQALKVNDFPVFDCISKF